MWFMSSPKSSSQRASASNEKVNVPIKENVQDNNETLTVVSKGVEPSGCSTSIQQKIRPYNFLETMICCASDLHSQFLTTGCKHIDKFLRGGIPCFGITEIFGESASAKTQMCLQLALFAQLQGGEEELTSRVVYISTEGSFPGKRMAELAENFSTWFDACNQRNPMDNIIVETVLDSESLSRCLRVRIPALVNEVKNSRIRLIVVDSLAAVYRTEYSISESVERAQDLREIGAKLHRLSRSLEAAVVVVNQATSSVKSGRNIPSLGLAWTNMVTTRIQMFRRPPDRFIEIVHAVHIPPGCMKIKLTHQGVSGVSEMKDEK